MTETRPCLRLMACMAFLVFLTYFCAGPNALASSGGVLAALPAHARLIASVPLPNASSTQAVTYAAGPSYVGVVSLRGARARLLWSRRLPLAPSALSTVGTGGLFSGRGSQAGTKRGEVFAFRLVDNQVESAIAEHRSGIIVADEGVKMIANGFVVRRHDTKHAGSVPYRLLRPYTLQDSLYVPGPPTRRPDLPAAQYPVPNGVIKTGGNVILLRLEVAATEQARSTGLMYRKQLDPDSGMVFVWTQDVLESFWMENTYIPLTVAFLSASGTVQEMQDMQPLTTDNHWPALPYRYAIEVNQGFFKNNGIKVGDQVQLHLDNTG